MKKIGKQLIVVFLGLAMLSLAACGTKTISKEFNPPVPVAQQQK